MTALGGIWNFTGRTAAGASLERMLAAQRIYGPHGDARWDGGNVAIGRSIFKTLPEDVYDQGPIAGGGGRYHLVADVRLDNRDELAAALRIEVAEARILPDAMIVMRAWERWGLDSFAHLYGDYAFAMWDQAEQRMILARDHIGGRPLHYHRNRQFLAFASMPKGLHALPEIPCLPDRVRAAEFLALMAEHDSRSFFQDVSRVEAGQVLVVTRDGLNGRKHWLPTYAPDGRSFADHVEGLREQIDRATATRLRGAEGRVGAHLSAGLDSSTIAATAARLLEPIGGNVAAFTSAPRAGYDGPLQAGQLGDETGLAAVTAAQYSNMEHVVLRTSGGSPLDDFDRDYFLFERPLVNTDIQRWWNQINAEASRRGLKVMLTGLMGNATMSYDGASLLGELATSLRWIELVKVGRAIRRRGTLRWTGIGAVAFGGMIPGPVWNALQQWRGQKPVRLDFYSAINPARADALDLRGKARALRHDFTYRPKTDTFAARLWMLRRIDFGNNQKGVLGGWGVDLRDPTTDRKLIEFCLSVPTHHYLRDGEMRALARHAFADRLPRSLLDERRRGLQAADWHEGLTSARGQLRSEIRRLRHVPFAAEALDLDRLERLTEDWPTGKWNTSEVDFDYRFLLIRGVASGHFLRKASGSNA